MFYIKICNKFLTTAVNWMFMSAILIVNILFIINPEKYIFIEGFEHGLESIPANFYKLLGLFMTLIIALGLIFIISNYYNGKLQVIDNAYSKSKVKRFKNRIILAYLIQYTIMFFITAFNGYYHYIKISGYSNLEPIIINIMISYFVLIILTILMANAFRKVHIGIMLIMFYYIGVEYAIPKYLGISGRVLDYMLTGHSEEFKYGYCLVLGIILIMYNMYLNKIKSN